MKPTESEVCTSLALAMFMWLYVVDVQLFFLTIVAITVSEITMVFMDYANAQVEMYIAYLQYMKDHKHDD